IEQPFCLQARLHAQELLVQSACPALAHAIDHHLQLAARLVDAQLPPHFHHQTIAGGEVQLAKGAPEHGTAQAGAPLLVLEREIAVSAGGSGKAADLALDDALPEAGEQSLADGLHKGRYPPYTGVAFKHGCPLVCSWPAEIQTAPPARDAASHRTCEVHKPEK